MAIQNKFKKGKSLYATTLSSAIGTGTGDTITLGSTTNLPTDTEITLTFNRVDSNGDVNPSSQQERITGIIVGNNLTSYTRGVDNTTEQSHDLGTIVEYVFNSQDLNDIVDGIIAEHNQDRTHGVINPTAIKSNYETVSDGATVTFDGDTSNVFTVVLGGNRTLAVSNIDVGQTFIIRLTQDGTGSRTVTWFTTIKWVNGVAPTLTTTGDKTDVFGFICTSAGNYDGYIVGQNL